MDGIRGPVPGRIPTGGFDPPLRNGGLSGGTAVLVHPPIPSILVNQPSFPSNPIPNNIKSQIVKIELVHLKYYSHFYYSIILTKCEL